MEAVGQSIVINRPIEEVFDVATCQERCVVWRGPIVSTAKTSDGPVGVGSIYRHEVKFLGIKVEANPVITAWEPPQRAEIENQAGPITYHSSFVLEPAGEGTKVTTRIQAEIGGAFSRIPDALVYRALMRQHAADLESLKDMLESEVPITA